nr:MAK10-like protein [Tanacetum cinerariifolium]
DENPIRTLGDYSKPSHEGYMNTIELPEGNNMVPLRSDTILLVQNGCSFHGLQFEDPNQHLKDFFKLVDSLDLNGDNKERTRLHLFQFSLRDQASNLLERLPVGSIKIWEDLTTRFLAQFFPPGKTAKLINDILMFQQHQGESLSEAWTQDLALYDNESWNDPRDFAKPVKAISLPQDVPSTSDRCLIKLESQVQCLMEDHLALIHPTQVNKITSLCEICSGLHETQYYMENPKQAFVEYASLRIDESGARAKRPTPINKEGPCWNDEEIEWLDVEEPLDLVYTSEESVYESLIVEMPSLNYDFRIKREAIRFRRWIYRDNTKLGPEYLIGMDDEDEVTKFLIKNEEEIFTVRGDGVGNKPDGVASPAM